jgi:hypothetical protein
LIQVKRVICNCLTKDCRASSLPSSDKLSRLAIAELARAQRTLQKAVASAPTLGSVLRSVFFGMLDLVFLLLIPAMAQGEHLAALAAVSRRLRDKEFAARLRGESSVAALCSHHCDSQHSLILPGEVGETICKQAIAPARLAASGAGMRVTGTLVKHFAQTNLPKAPAC